MHIGGFSYAGTLSRPGHATSGAGLPPDDAEAADSRPLFFRSISSISPGSLAAAYQAIRAHDLTLVPVDPALPGEPNQEASVAEGFIDSGVGIAAAMNAYAEAMEPVAFG